MPLPDCCGLTNPMMTAVNQKLHFNWIIINESWSENVLFHRQLFGWAVIKLQFLIEKINKLTDQQRNTVTIPITESCSSTIYGKLWFTCMFVLFLKIVYYGYMPLVRSLVLFFSSPFIFSISILFSFSYRCVPMNN